MPGAHADDKAAVIFVKQMSRAVKDSLPPLSSSSPVHSFICVFVRWDFLRGSRSEALDVEIDERLEMAGKRVARL